MKARVEQLALVYRLPGGVPRVVEQLPSLEREMHALLADRIASHFDAIAEGSDDVIVIREATVRVTVRLGQGTRDANAVDRVSHAARDALIALIARPADDEHVRRFPSGADFAGAFVVGLLEGAAWDRWYFESFQRFRRADPGGTIIALLADADTDCVALFAWLESRGRLADVLALVGAPAARILASASPATDPTSSPPPDLIPLAAAAFAMAATVGFHVEAHRHGALLRDYHRLNPSRPVWDDRAALTAWVWTFTRWVVSGERTARDSSSETPENATEVAEFTALVTQQLDWLDGPLLATRVEDLMLPSGEPRHVPPREQLPLAVAPRHTAQLRTLVDSIQRGSLRLDLRTEPHDQLLLRLVAASHAPEGTAASQLDRAFIATLDAVLDAALSIAARETAPSPQMHSRNHHTPHRDVAIADPPARAIETVRSHGPEAGALLRTLLASVAPDARARSRFVGIFLLTRPITDLRLDQLAERSGVPWAPLLAALSMKIVGAVAPFDEAMQTWFGSPRADVSLLNESGLRALQRLVLQSLADQRQLPTDALALTRFDWRGETFNAFSDASGTCSPLVARADSLEADALRSEWNEAVGSEAMTVAAPRALTADLDLLVPAPALPAAIEVLVTSLATCVLHAMSRWLPGIAGSSAPFLVRNCIARGGSVSVTDEEITVVLDRAPLDIVLEMAGCLSPMKTARWLDRSLRFSLASTER